MNILIFSMAPIFLDYVQGGSQKILCNIATHLGEKHKVKILCPSRDDNSEPFELCPNVTVSPVLPFKGYPEPYYIPPYSLQLAAEIIHKESKKSDVVYVHDSEMNFSFFYDILSIPIVSSLRDFIYPDTLLGAFNFRRDKVIVNSEYVYKCLSSTLKHIFPDIIDRVELIPNGIDLSKFKPTRARGARLR